MDEVEFRQRVEESQLLSDFLEGIAQKAARETSSDEIDRSLSGLELLFGAAAYALFRWVKDHFDRRGNLDAAELLERQEKVIAALIKEGLSPPEARATVLALVEALADRRSDDPILRSALALISEGKNSAPGN
jgi:hypothetical protein